MNSFNNRVIELPLRVKYLDRPLETHGVVRQALRTRAQCTASHLIEVTLGNLCAPKSVVKLDQNEVQQPRAHMAAQLVRCRTLRERRHFADEASGSRIANTITASDSLALSRTAIKEKM